MKGKENEYLIKFYILTECYLFLWQYKRDTERGRATTTIKGLKTFSPKSAGRSNKTCVYVNVKKNPTNSK